MKIFTKSDQAYGAFNNGQIVENKPLGFPQDGGELRPYSNLFYWANAEANRDSTIGLHPHQGFEIMSFVLEGKIRHFDTKLKSWRDLEAGDVQIIRAGNGISHMEFMAEGSRMFQIWADPDLSQSLSKEASYDDYAGHLFPTESSDGVTRTTLIGEGSPLSMDTPHFYVERIDIDGSHTLKREENETLSVYCLKGDFSFNDNAVRQDDFVLDHSNDVINIKGQGELFVIRSLIDPGYKTYANRFKN